MSRSRLLATTLIMATAAASQADDGDYRLFGSTTTTFERNRPEDGETYDKLKQVFNLNLEWQDFTAGVQLQYLDYSDREQVDPLDLDRLHDTWELRKYYLDYSKGPLQARLGTFFTSFGHGLTLFVQKNDALGLDEPVHGATATVTLGRYDFIAVGGRVTEPLLESQYGRRFEDELLGGRVLARLPHDLHIGASWVDARLDRFFPSEGFDDVRTWSLEAGGIEVAGLFDIQAEVSELELDDGDRVKEGYGRYVSVSSTLGPITALGEYKDYWNFDYRYNTPPNAGRAVEAYEHRDVKGARLRLEGEILATGTLLYGSYGSFDSHRREGSFGGLDGDRQVEWYLGLEEMAGPVYLESSYFARRWRDRGIRERHTIADFHLTVGDRGEVIVGYDGRLEKADYFRLGIHRCHLAYSLAPYGTLSLRHAWDDSSLGDEDRYWGGELELNPIRAMTISIFAGSDPGGLVCSGGQCREEPRFEGVRARFTWRF
jgi:hypothetical protein